MNIAIDKEQQNLFPDLKEYPGTKPDNIRYAFQAMLWLERYYLRRFFENGMITFADFIWYYAEEGDKAFVPEWAYEKRVQMVQWCIPLKNVKVRKYV